MVLDSKIFLRQRRKWMFSVSVLFAAIFILDKMYFIEIPNIPVKQKLSPCELKLKSLTRTNFTYPFTSSKTYKGPIVRGWPPSANRNISNYIEKNSFFVLPRNVSLTSTELLVIIKSRVDGLEKRNFIRYLWGRTLRKLNPASKIVFVLGINKDIKYNYLDGESEFFGDIVQGNFIDTYNNLTLKTVFAYKYVLETNWIHRPKMILTLDDDMYVNIPMFLEEINRLNNICEGPYLMGLVAPYYNPIVDSNDNMYSSKWGIPSYMLSYGTYPPYVKGFLTLLSFETVECLYQEAFNLPYFHIEDIFFGGFCAKRCGITPKKFKYDVLDITDKDPETLDFSKDLATLTSSFEQHMKMHENMLKNYQL